MTDSPTRRPATFRLDDPHVTLQTADAEPTRRARGEVRIVQEADASQLPVPLGDIAPPPRTLRWGAVFWTALAGLVLLGGALSVIGLVEDLFARNETLGVVGAALAAVAALALIAILAREASGLARLAAIEGLQARAREVLATDDRKAAQAVVRDALKLASENPHLARARAKLHAHEGDIIDGADRIRLAERELMAPLDREARRMVRVAAQRVSVVTAVSPRALIDILFVLAAAVRLTRQLARLYGGRPGLLGLLKLLRQTIAHLAITGTLAASDSLIQQVLGHGIAAKLSTRLGEGILNGLLTARLGLAAIDIIRPFPFAALPRPVLTDLARELTQRHDDETVDSRRYDGSPASPTI